MITEGWVDYLTGTWGVAFAFAAGVISFLSPCVLPLVPAYIAHLTGVGATGATGTPRRETMSHALAFVLGFGLIFTIIGASVGLVGSLISGELATLEKIAGIFLIILGLNLMGVIKVPWLYRTYQLGSGRFGEATSGGQQATRGETGGTLTMVARTGPTVLSYGRSAGLGASFAVAWTPCIGPVLGAILTLAATSSTVHQGAFLLLGYSAGLAVPFLIAGYALSSVTSILRRFHRLLPALEIATGALIVVVGVLVFLNELTSLNQYFDFIEELNAV